MCRRLLTALLLLASPASATQAPPRPAAPQAPAPVFPGQAELVTVDVVVTDKDGSPVSGLAREDFMLLDEGQSQAITSFESVRVPSAAPAGPPPVRTRLATNGLPADRTGRTFVLVFDNVHMSPLHAYRAKQALANFLEKGARPSDRVSLISTGGGAWWSTRMPEGREDLLALVKGLEGRRIRDATSREQITDFEAVRVHLFQDTLVGNRVLRRFEAMGVKMRETAQRSQDYRELYLSGVNDFLVEARAAEVYQQVRSRLNVTLAALERAVRALAGNRGRKALILVSEGFVLDPTLDDFKAVVEGARRSNVALYFVDTRGLQGLSSAFDVQLGAPLDARDFGAVWADATQDAEGSEMLADDTGGFSVRTSNDLARAIGRIAHEAESYYLLGYVPPAGPRDGRFRKVQVKVRRKGLRVRARKGYYAPLDAPAAGATLALAGDPKAASRAAPPPSPTPKPKPAEADRDIQEALDSPFPRDDVRIRMTAFVLEEALLGKARTLLAAEVDAANLDFLEKEGRLVDTLDVLMVAAHRETGEYQRRDQKLEMGLQPETRERLRQTWYSIIQEFELTPGGYQARIVVRDGNSRKLGTLTYEFEVPELKQLRVSTPILTDSVRQPPGQSAPAPVLVARRSFPSGATLYCQFDVYGAQKDGAGMPRVTASYLLRRADGTTRERGGPTSVVPTSLGRISQLMWLPLEGAEPGDYELVLAIKDELAGQVREVSEPFTVTPPLAAAAAR